MSDRHLIHQLSELRSVKRAPALWRAQTRERLLATVAAAPGTRYAWSERFGLMVQEVRLTFAPVRLAPVLVAVVVMAVGAAPFGQAVAAALPGSSLYGVKRGVERVELSFKSNPVSQGLFHLALAERRLVETKAVPAASPGLLRDYNIDLGFAQAALQASPASSSLAVVYDRAANELGTGLRHLSVGAGASAAYAVAVGLTDQLAADSLALLVGSHVSGQNGVAQEALAARLTQEIAKVSQKLDTVDTKLQQFPATKAGARVVLERKEAIVPAKEARSLAEKSLTEAKELVAKKEFSLALEKVQESEEITQKTEAAVDKATSAEATPSDGTVVPEPEVRGESTTPTDDGTPPATTPDTTSDPAPSPAAPSPTP